MGFFTYRQTKKTKREVHALRQQQAASAEFDRTTTLFQQLPPEGKAEYRALQEQCRSSWKDGLIQEIGKQNKLAKGQQEIFRRYDLIP